MALLLRDSLGFEHELLTMDQNNIEDYLFSKLKEVPLETFVRNMPVEDLIESNATESEGPVQMTLLEETEAGGEEINELSGEDF